MSNRQVARLAGVSEDTVRQRLRKLEERGLIRFTLVIDAPSVPLNAMAYVRIKTETRLTNNIALALAALPACSFVGLGLGRYDIIALLNEVSREEVQQVISEQVAILPGVQALDVREPVGVAKNDPYRVHLVN